MAEDIQRPEDKHPEQWRRDLNPDSTTEGESDRREIEPPRKARSAYDEKPLHTLLSDFSAEEMKRIPLMPPGGRLSQGATYLNLGEAAPQEFTAAGIETVDANAWIVPKKDTDYGLWNRLLGLTSVKRVVTG